MQTLFKIGSYSFNLSQDSTEPIYIEIQGEKKGETAKVWLTSRHYALLAELGEGLSQALVDEFMAMIEFRARWIVDKWLIQYRSVGYYC